MLMDLYEGTLGNTMQNRLLLTALLSAAALASTAQAATTDEAFDANGFARTLAATAKSAETNAFPRDAASIQRQVAASVEELIVTAAKPPQNVRVALQQTVYVCIRPAEIQRLSFNCPTTQSGLAGLQDVLTTVIALIDGASTATVDGPGAAAFTPPPEGKFGAAGSDYLKVQ
jgi:hypothetical protein